MSGGHNGLRVAAIVLAAGRSTRMAPDNKLLAGFDGVPMVRGVATTAVASGARPVVVVTGFQAGRVADALTGLDITIVHNRAYGDGLSASLRTGLGALPPDCDGALICLGDMPAIESGDLRVLMAAFAAGEGRAICVPVRHGRRGNPVLWSAAFFGEMMALTGDTGAKGLIGRHEDCVTEVAMSSDSIFEDVDAPSDLERRKPTQGSTL
jgi:molybdenum cofactor cytidylyltransferase